MDERLIRLDHLLSPLYYEDPASLSGTELNVVLIFEARREIENGGFDQFFFNTTGQYTAETLAALEAVGAAGAHGLMERAAAVFPNKVPRTFSARQRAMEKIEPLAAPLWAELTEVFLAEDLETVLLEYIAGHPEGFR